MLLPTDAPLPDQVTNVNFDMRSIISCMECRLNRNTN